MSKLRKDQILYISNDLKSKGLSKGFRTEILDHLCCQIEEKLEVNNDFNNAYRESLNEFGNQGFEEFKKTSPIVIKKRKVMFTQLLTVFMATVLTFSTFKLVQSEPPSIHPIHQGVEITSTFGLRFDPLKKIKRQHIGIDFKSKTGTPVKATGSGVVVEVSQNTPYGNKVVIKHDEEYQTLYAHMHELKVTQGQEIKKGQVIGTVGSTGRSTGPHLHYEVIKNGKNVDPLNYLDTKSN